MIDNPDTVEGWQEWFDATFPLGVNALRYDGLQMLCPFIRVDHLENDNEAVISFFAMHLDTKIMSLQVESVEEKSDSEWVIHTSDEDDNDWIFSTGFADSIGQAMKEYRDEQEALRKKYAD